jgi:PTH1 family peptidyl-tRNA hydrolase
MSEIELKMTFDIEENIVSPVYRLHLERASFPKETPSWYAWYNLSMMYTLIPLGNPGDKYARTRHNVARVLLAMIKDDVMQTPSLEVMVPQTFMNDSGQAVREYLRYHEGREIIVMYDDKDLPYGVFRISYDRGDGGHNGLKSIIDALQKKDFVRIRIGIAPKEVDGLEVKAPHGKEVQGYVLGGIREEEEEILRTVATRVLGAIQTITSKGYQKAMEVYNGN